MSKHKKERKMNHIETKSALESDMRAKYANAKDAAIEASDELAEKVAELLALRHKMDEDELRKSTLMGEIMSEMKTSTVLKDKTGRVIVTWRAATEKKTTDWKGLCKKLKPSKELVAEFTTSKLGARTFELIEDQAECEDVVSLIDQMKV